MTRDPGLQPERTRLAWQRTAAGFAANALLAGRAALQTRDLAPVVATAALCAALVVWLWASRTRGSRSTALCAAASATSLAALITLLALA